MRKRLIVSLVIFLALELPARFVVSQSRLQMETMPTLLVMEFGDVVTPHWRSVSDYLVPDDLTSDRVNYRDGFRVTTGQPATWTRTVWIIGPSNVSGNELADSETLPSQLQALMPTVRVVNVGASGANTAQLAARLDTLPIVRGDIVMLMAGAVESYGIYRETSAMRGSRLTDGLCSVLTHYVKLAIVTVACWSDQFDDSPIWSDDRFVASSINQYEAYSRSVERMRRTTTASGATFVNVVAPYCRCVWYEDYHGIERSFEAFAAQARADTTTMDYSRQVPDGDFYSLAHINAYGSGIVARALAAQLTKQDTQGGETENRDMCYILRANERIQCNVSF